MQQVQEVKLRIKGFHDQGREQEEPIEIVTIGQMIQQKDFFCVKYDEVIDEDENGIVQTQKNTLKIKENHVEILRQGTHLVFMPNQTTFNYYTTPFGELEITIHTTCVEKNDYDGGFRINIQYEMEMNQTFISSCNVSVAVEF